MVNVGRKRQHCQDWISLESYTCSWIYVSMSKTRENLEYRCVYDSKYKVFLHYNEPRIGWQYIILWITLHFSFVLNYVWIWFKLSSKQCHGHEMKITSSASKCVYQIHVCVLLSQVSLITNSLTHIKIQRVLRLGEKLWVY